MNFVKRKGLLEKVVNALGHVLHGVYTVKPGLEVGCSQLADPEGDMPFVERSMSLMQEDSADHAAEGFLISNGDLTDTAGAGDRACMQRMNDMIGQGYALGIIGNRDLTHFKFLPPFITQRAIVKAIAYEFVVGPAHRLKTGVARDRDLMWIDGAGKPFAEWICTQVSSLKHCLVYVDASSHPVAELGADGKPNPAVKLAYVQKEKEQKILNFCNELSESQLQTWWVKYHLANTMGAVPAFANRKIELSKLAGPVTDEQVTQSFLNDLRPYHGAKFKYLTQAHVAIVINNVLYVHGAFNEGVLDMQLPDGKGPFQTVQEWADRINILKNELVAEIAKLRSADTLTPRGMLLFNFFSEMTLPLARTNNQTCISDRPRDTAPSADGRDASPQRNAPQSARLQEFLDRSGISVIVVGHQPVVSESPLFLRTQTEESAYTWLCVDTSRNHGKNAAVNAQIIHRADGAIDAVVTVVHENGKRSLRKLPLVDANGQAVRFELNDPRGLIGKAVYMTHTQPVDGVVPKLVDRTPLNDILHYIQDVRLNEFQAVMVTVHCAMSSTPFVSFEEKEMPYAAAALMQDARNVAMVGTKLPSVDELTRRMQSDAMASFRPRPQIGAGLWGFAAPRSHSGDVQIKTVQAEKPGSYLR